MDTKWKSNKEKSIGIALLLTLLVTIVFICLFPFFAQRADSEFENPLMNNSFISMLYESNYVQYKFLREKADQKSYSYSDLFVEEDFLGVYLSSDYIEPDRYVNVPPNARSDTEALAERVREEKESSLVEIVNMKNYASELTQLMDYYAVDSITGATIGNSNLPALKEILNGETPEDNPYVYYVYMNYDAAGNLANCGVSATGNVGEFLKKVEAIGREQFFKAPYDEDGNLYINFYNDEEDERYRYKFSTKKPANMKIIYAMTNEQYQSFVNGYENLDTYRMLPNLVTVSLNSYYSAGIFNILKSFLMISICSGLLSVWFFNRKQKRAYIYQELWVCRLPVEFNIVIVSVIFAIGDKMMKMICSYQKGWFLPNLTKHFLEPVHMQWFRIIIVVAAFFLYFLAAYTMGTTFNGIFHLKQYIKRNSLLYRYWDKIFTYLKDFYDELVNFDIGTNAKKIISKLVITNFIVLFLISLMWVWGIVPLTIYSFVVYFLLKKYVKDVQEKYRNLLKATSAIASGDLDIALSEDFGVFESYKLQLRQIQTDFKRAVDEEVKSQRMKSELITNVSHDLKTPLTAIITYINLLKEPGISDEQKAEYIQTLDKKAVRLKVLIEDLFEVSKATTKNITLNYAQVDIGNLLRQCCLEYEDRIGEADLQFKIILPEEKVFLTLDPQKTFRIIENLYTNIIKYALPSTRVYVIMKEREDDVLIEVKNISRTELQISPEELSERFVRGDGSRNTEGSGLGLAIAKSFTELQHGAMNISVDGDLFKVILIFRKWSGPADSPEEDKILSNGDNPDSENPVENGRPGTAIPVWRPGMRRSNAGKDEKPKKSKK